EGRVRREGENRTVAGIERHDRAAVRGPAADALRGVGRSDSGCDAPLGSPLQVHVERQADRLARNRRLLRHLLADRPPESVDAPLRQSVLAAQVGVVARLDAALAYVVAQVVAPATVELVLRRRDRSHAAEDLSGKRLVRVAAQVRRDELDTWEDALALLQVEVLRTVDRLLDRDWDARVAAPLLELTDHFGDRHVD